MMAAANALALSKAEEAQQEVAHARAMVVAKAEGESATLRQVAKLKGEVVALEAAREEAREEAGTDPSPFKLYFF